ncbi:protein O-mannosyl-transferase 2 [Episyrphus balteatus]|uniref:protein O-mannosyl-transferase 2 n=1 Tax=Episyrphus balteatus TaxID=286459 RepID=UPI002486351E|nr:protein O-mannosyl-transferase 2 [Episyrphus balteatus]
MCNKSDRKSENSSKHRNYEKSLIKSEKDIEKLNWWVIFGAVIVLTAATRYYKVTEPDHVCWDETHFGKMGSWYINRTFFFDVHPPLGKMLIGLSGYLTGYNGTYPFDKPGDKYNSTRYEGMRYFCTTLGALIVPMAFDTVHDLTGSNEAALVATAYLIFDVGLITLNQYILLDPILLCFMVASVWGMVKISKVTRSGESYTLRWWCWLYFTGTMLACTISVKFVGLFIVLLVGFHTVSELWVILGDLDKPLVETIKQTFCRALALILWPIFLYMVFFFIHLSVLNRSGNGDGFYSSAFQSRLIGNSLYNVSMPREVAYGAVVTIKNHKTGGGYLHSHYHLYPKNVGARQQQITTYTHKDENNKWLIKPYNEETIPELKMLKNGDLVRLEHVPTKRNLHSHAVPAPLTKKHHQVTGYGEDGVGDANDVWRVVIIGGRDEDIVQTVSTKILLVHYMQNCALTSSGLQLPKWGFEQQEVSCNPNLRDRNAYWNVEDNVHKKLPSVSFHVYAPGFWSRFIESHAVMFQGNAGLKPKEGEVTSRPWQWPINYRGQFFSGTAYRIYLLGNPIIWWSNLIFLALFLIVFFITAVKERRREGQRQQQHQQQQYHPLRQQQQQNKLLQGHSNTSYLRNPENGTATGSSTTSSTPTNTIISATTEDLNEESRSVTPVGRASASTPARANNNNGNVGEENELRLQSLTGATWLFIGWVLHYLPFWAMGRVLYFHHYFPALIFNSMLTGIMFNYITARLSRWTQHVIMGTLMSILVYSFMLFSPLAYGATGPMANEANSTMYRLKWLSSWEF